MLWNIGVYLRLSNDDGDKAESNSISSQRTLILDYIKKNISDGEIIEVFIDDGFTGTNFNRPDFKRMIQFIENGEINCVIVKDLSRFGRDYIGVGNYIEKYFPLHDVRFIAINDGYDSSTRNSSDDFSMPIKNIFNAHYSKDISKKVKTSFRTLQNQGQFVGAFASYGYKKNENNKHKLVIDEPSAIIVRKIFNLFLSGNGKNSIAKILNEDGIPCPSEYKRLNGLKYTNGSRLELTKYWTYSTINNILHNRMYIGDMVQNKYGRKFVRGKAKKNSVEDWIIIEGTHEPIIDKHTWELTQDLLVKNTRQLSFDSNVGMFAGYIICGDCKRAMSKIKYKNNKSYICGSYKRYGKDICYRNSIKEDELEEIILAKLNEQIPKIDKFEEIKTNTNKDYTNDINKLNILLNKVRGKKRRIYEDYQDDILTKEEYLGYKQDYIKEENHLLKQIEELNNETAKLQDSDTWLQKINKYKKIEHLNREIIAELIEKIIVSHDGDKDDSSIKVEVIFKFKFL